MRKLCIFTVPVAIVAVLLVTVGCEKDIHEARYPSNQPLAQR
jgi:hypothetical protein